MPIALIKILRGNVVLILIIAMFSVLVSYNILGQGLIDCDEGYYLAITHTFSTFLKTFFSHPALLFDSSFYTDLTNQYGMVNTTAKPFFILPSVFLDFIYTSEYTVRFINMLAGALTIIMFYKLLGLFDLNKEKIISALFLATSPLLIAFSRIGMPTTVTAFLLLLSVFCFFKFYLQENKEKRRWLWLTGLSVSLTFMSHYGTLISVLIIICGVIYLLFKNKTPLPVYIYFIISCVLIPILWEVAGRLMFFFVHLKGIAIADKDNRVMTYFQEIAEQMYQSGATQGFRFDHLFSYLQFFISSEGIIVGLMFLAGIMLFLKYFRKDFRYQFLIFFVFASLIFISLSHVRVARVLVPFAPFLYLFVALFLSKIKSNKILFALVIVVLALRILPLSHIINSKSYSLEISDFIKRFQPKEVVVFGGPPSNIRAHLWGQGYKIEGLPPTKEEARIAAGSVSKALFIIDVGGETEKWLQKSNAVLVVEYYPSFRETRQFLANGGLDLLADDSKQKQTSKTSVYLLDFQKQSF